MDYYRSFFYYFLPILKIFFPQQDFFSRCDKFSLLKYAKYVLIDYVDYTYCCKQGLCNLKDNFKNPYEKRITIFHQNH